jgi:excisionase family DNA binding protein
MDNLKGQRELPNRLKELLHSAAALSPVGATIPAAQQLTGLSRSEVYRLLAAGELRAIKRGARTLILWESLTEYLASLPAAIFRNPLGS